MTHLTAMLASTTQLTDRGPSGSASCCRCAGDRPASDGTLTPARQSRRGRRVPPRSGSSGARARARRPSGPRATSSGASRPHRCCESRPGPCGNPHGDIAMISCGRATAVTGLVALAPRVDVRPPIQRTDTLRRCGRSPAVLSAMVSSWIRSRLEEVAMSFYLCAPMAALLTLTILTPIPASAAPPDDAYVAGYAAAVLEREFNSPAPSLRVRDGVLTVAESDLAGADRARVVITLSRIPGVNQVDVLTAPALAPSASSGTQSSVRGDVPELAEGASAGAVSTSTWFTPGMRESVMTARARSAPARSDSATVRTPSRTRREGAGELNSRSSTAAAYPAT